MKLFKCEICGNLVELIEEGKGTLVCCGQAMTKLEVNSEETKFEKHIPVIKKVNNGIEVTVGSVMHPMLEEHYIEWIALVTPNKITKVLLKPGESPVTRFEIEDDEYTVYAYCNIHGLYKA